MHKGDHRSWKSLMKQLHPFVDVVPYTSMLEGDEEEDDDDMDDNCNISFQ